MTFARVKPSGWVEPDPITAAQINQLDIDHANAIDGAGGGAYAPSDPLDIGGDGLIVSGPLVVTGSFAVHTRLDALEAVVAGVAGSYILEVPLVAHYNGGPRFTTANFGGYLQNDITDVGELLFPFPRFSFGKIDQLHIVVDGRDGTFGSAHAGLPATMPKLALKTLTAVAGNTNKSTGAVGATATDSSASAAAYDTVHLISKTGLAHAVLADTAYWVSVTGEAGANALTNNFAVYRCYAVITP